MARRAGFTLIEIAVTLVVVSLLMLIGLPKFSTAMAKSDVRAARTMMVNMLAKSRAASTEANRRTWLKVGGNRAWILARPRLNPVAGSDADTLGIVENLSTRYGATLAVSPVDSIGFDPRGIAWSGTTVTISISKYGHTDVVTIDGLGRVVK